MNKKKLSAKPLKKSNTGALLLIALPGILYLLVNNYIPLAGLFIAFKDYKFSKGIWGSNWCGFKNFRLLFISNDAFIITRNTLLYNLAFIIAGTAVAVFTAVALYELGTSIFTKIFQSGLLLPHLISWIIASYLFYALFNSSNGFLNHTILPLLGIEPFDWYTAKNCWPILLVLIYLWKHTGYTAIVYLASISGIDHGIYESAALDGASRLQQIRHITIPLLKPTIITMVLMNVGRIFYSDFGLFYQIPMDSGQLYSVTQTIDTYVYRALMVNGNLTVSAAAGFYQSICGFILIVTVNHIVKRISPDNALF